MVSPRLRMCIVICFCDGIHRVLCGYAFSLPPCQQVLERAENKLSHEADLAQILVGPFGNHTVLGKSFNLSQSPIKQGCYEGKMSKCLFAHT